MYTHSWKVGLSLVVAAAIAAASQQSGGAPAQKAGGTTDSPQPAAAKDQQQGVLTPEQEAEALSFIRKNYPDLAELVRELKDCNPKQYQPVLRELSKTCATLVELEKREPARYDIELKAWQIRSRIEVLAARLTCAHDQAMEDQLKAALLEQVDIRVRRQQYELERLEQRIERLKAVIEKTRKSREQEAQRAFDEVKQCIEKARHAAKAGEQKSPKSESK